MTRIKVRIGYWMGFGGLVMSVMIILTLLGNSVKYRILRFPSTLTHKLPFSLFFISMNPGPYHLSTN